MDVLLCHLLLFLIPRSHFTAVLLFGTSSSQAAAAAGGRGKEALHEALLDAQIGAEQGAGVRLQPLGQLAHAEYERLLQLPNGRRGQRGNGGQAALGQPSGQGDGEPGQAHQLEQLPVDAKVEARLEGLKEQLQIGPAQAGGEDLQLAGKGGRVLLQLLQGGPLQAVPPAHLRQRPLSHQVVEGEGNVEAAVGHQLSGGGRALGRLRRGTSRGGHPSVEVALLDANQLGGDGPFLRGEALQKDLIEVVGPVEAVGVLLREVGRRQQVHQVEVVEETEAATGRLQLGLVEGGVVGREAAGHHGFAEKFQDALAVDEPSLEEKVHHRLDGRLEELVGGGTSLTGAKEGALGNVAADVLAGVPSSLNAAAAFVGHPGKDQPPQRQLVVVGARPTEEHRLAHLVVAHPPGPAHHLPEGGHIQRRAVELERRPDEDAARGHVHAGAQRGGGDEDAQRPVAVRCLEERPLLCAQAGVVKGDAKPDDHLEGVEVRVAKVTTTATTTTASSSTSSSLLAPALLQLAEQVDNLRLGELPAQGGSNRQSCGGLAFGGDEGVQLAGDASGGLLAEPFRRAEDQGGVAAGQCLQGGVNQRRLLPVDVGGKCASRKLVQGEKVSRLMTLCGTTTTVLFSLSSSSSWFSSKSSWHSWSACFVVFVSYTLRPLTMRWCSGTGRQLVTYSSASSQRASSGSILFAFSMVHTATATRSRPPRGLTLPAKQSMRLPTRRISGFSEAV
ncbi:hypothetical protein TYRP_011864 [Tyrophagus putrescentiae]|nr:hypothetical protein TYRP_011864 [Tyrophagus putrescentiae]